MKLRTHKNCNNTKNIFNQCNHLFHTIASRVPSVKHKVMMDLFNYIPSLGSDHISVEANSDGFTFLSNSFDVPNDMDLDSNLNFLFDSDQLISEIDVAGVCESADLVDSITHSVEPNEFDKYLGPTVVPHPTSDINQNLLLYNGLPVHFIDKNKKVKENKKPIPLSSSVGVGLPQRLLKRSYKIEIVYELEAKFRPRYKSDYFGQNGKKRRPRYVTDRNGKHCITLKVPPGIRGRIRIDWLTVPAENGNRYLMPYQFQASHDSAEIPDCNPTFEDITTDPSGIMKIYLVLIKAKQDALKSRQPLQAFHPIKDAFGIIDKQTPEKIPKLTPKQLIKKYQLNKSQLAFTLCTLRTDGKSYAPEWDTTVYSTVLEEEAIDSPSAKSVSCPKCSYRIPINDDVDTDQEITTNKRKSLEIKATKPNIVKKQKGLPEMIYCVN